jgi:uncharacterized protein (TIGR03437 family)
MDAAQKLIKNIAILTAATLLLSTVGLAANLVATPTTVVLPPATAFHTAAVSSSDGTTVINYTIGATNYNGGDPAWLTVTGGTATPATLNFQARGVAFVSASPHTATVTLTPTTGTPVMITVSYDTGGGGGGGGSTLIPSQPSIALTSAANSTTINIMNGSAASIQIFNPPTVSASWLTAAMGGYTLASGASAALFVSANSSGLAAQTYQGTVTLIPSTGTQLVINVTFTVGGGGGGGSGWSTNPSSIAWNFTTNTGVYPSLGVTVTPTSAAAAYNVSTTANNSPVHWLLVAANGQPANVIATSIPLGTPFTLSVGSVANGLSQGTYTEQAIITDDSAGQQATLTVTLTVNGGAASGLTISPGTVQFTSVLNGAQQTKAVSVTGSTTGNLSVNGCNTLTWLTCTLPANTSITPGVATSFNVIVNPTGLAANTYTTTLQVQAGSQTGTVNVSLSVSGSGTGPALVAPASLSFYYELGSPTSYVAQQKLVITGPAGAWSSITSVTAPIGGTWISLSPSSGSALPDPANDAAAPVVTIDPTGLTVGLWGGKITMTTPGGTQVIQVLLNVVSSTIILPTPSGTLIFTARTGQPKPAPKGLFWVDSDSALTLDSPPITATADNSWITVSNPARGTVTVQVDQTGMAAGVYTGSVSLTQAGAANSPAKVPILMVVSGGTAGSLTFSPGSIGFTSTNGSAPAPATLSVSATTATSFTTSVAYATGSGWLTVSPLSGTTPANLTVSANPSGLATGITYGATISFNSNGAVQTVSVTLTVSNGTNTGNITVSPTSLAFTTPQGTNPTSKTLSVSSAAGAAGIAFTVNSTTNSGGGWLSTSVSSGTTPLNPLTVIVNSSALAANTYTGTILITPAGGLQVSIPVTLTVTAPANISATPTSMTFDYRLGDAAPAATPLTVSGSAAFNATATSTGNWLVATPTSGTAPTTVNVSINKNNITSTGTLNGTVLVAATGGATGSTTVNVTLNVTSLPTISSVTNAASYTNNAISPGEIITLFANDPAHPIGPATPAYLTLDATGNVATSIGGVQVTVNGFNCPMIYASASQVSAVVPYEAKAYATATVLVKYLGQGSNGVPMTVATTVPGLFTINTSGTGQGAILNSDLSVNSAANPVNPAARGDVVVIYMTGEGETAPNGVTGKVTTVDLTPGHPLTPAPLLPVSVTIGGQPAQWTFAGEAPGFVSGVLQLNVVVPTNIAAGNQPIVVTIGGNPSQQGVTVSVK